MSCNINVILFITNTVVTAGNDGTVRVWEVATGVCKKVLKGHDYPINCMTVYSLCNTSLVFSRLSNYVLRYSITISLLLHVVVSQCTGV